jgi:ABC-type lipoprotein export system ATPase subunit
LVGLAAKKGKTVLVASHDPQVVESFPRVFHMRDGMIERAA